MTKNELLNRLQDLLQEKGMYAIGHPLSGVFGRNDRKTTLEDAIKCLEATDEEMHDYLTVVKLAYPGTYKAVMEAGNYLTHKYNRYYVYATAKMVLKTA